MKPQLEICCFSLQSAINAQNAGADRVELCDNMFEGGTTPSFGLIQLTRENLSIQLNVIIRPRGGDFLYSDFEFEIMKREIIQSKEMGVDGVALGILTKNGTIDLKRTEELIMLSKPMSVTFHRAFDMVKDRFFSLHELIELNVDRVLTSGGRQTAPEGMHEIKKLVEQSGENIIIMPGSGVNHNTIQSLVNYTNAREFHLSAKKGIPSSMKYKNSKINMGGIKGIPEYEYYEADIEMIKRVNKILKTDITF